MSEKQIRRHRELEMIPWLPVQAQYLQLCTIIMMKVMASLKQGSIQRFVIIIMEEAPTRAFSWLKAATTAFTFNVKLGLQCNYHK